MFKHRIPQVVRILMSVGQHTYDNTGRRRHDIEAFTGNTGVWVGLVQTKTKMRFKKMRWLQVVNKLDEDQVRRIVRQNRNGARTNRELAETFGISMRWVQKLCSKYRNAGA